jgi:hypothetical protein
VVLNKIDTLVDPLLTADEVQAQIEQQRLGTAHTLGVQEARVFALSAREALAARLDDEAGLAASRLPPLEARWPPSCCRAGANCWCSRPWLVVEQLRASGGRRLNDRRRQHAEQLLELRGLRGKSGTKMRLMVERVDAEARLRALHGAPAGVARGAAAQLRDVLAPLASESCAPRWRHAVGDGRAALQPGRQRGL